MRIGRIGNVGATSYVPSVQRTASRAEKPEQEKEKKLPGWEGSDSYVPSQKPAKEDSDGRVTATGGQDYLSNYAANAARFDNFDL